MSTLHEGFHYNIYNLLSNIIIISQEGQLSRLKSLISSSRGSLNVHSPSSGDTPLIVAAREGHKEIITFLLMMGADVTIENDADENALDVGTEEIRRLILSEHEWVWFRHTVQELPIECLVLHVNNLLLLLFRLHPTRGQSH